MARVELLDRTAWVTGHDSRVGFYGDLYGYGWVMSSAMASLEARPGGEGAGSRNRGRTVATAWKHRGAWRHLHARCGEPGRKQCRGAISISRWLFLEITTGSW